MTAEDSVWPCISRTPVWDASLVDRLNTPEYFGTIVKDLSVDTELEVLHMVCTIPPLRLGQIRAQELVSILTVSFMIIFLSAVSGHSTAGASKSSYKFDFNKGSHFRFDPDEGRCRRI